MCRQHCEVRAVSTVYDAEYDGKDDNPTLAIKITCSLSYWSVLGLIESHSVRDKLMKYFKCRRVQLICVIPRIRLFHVPPQYNADTSQT